MSNGGPAGDVPGGAAPAVAVVGVGYVGLVTAACLAERGAQVRCHDADGARLQAVASGKPPFHEPGLPELLARNLAAGRIQAFAGLKDALAGAAHAFIAVGTPAMADGSADLRHVWAVVEALAAHAPRGMTVVLRSTVPPGTGDQAAQELRRRGRGDLDVVNAPEFLAEGTAVRDFMQPDRLVFGGERRRAEGVAALFAAIRPEAPRLFTSRATAELSKYAANAFLAARVSLVNEMAALCAAAGGDVRQLAEAVGLDARVGSRFLRPGIGYGGSCFPKDLQALGTLGRQLGVDLRLIPAIGAANEAQADRALAGLRRMVPRPEGARIAVWGLAFKPDTDDTRMAPALRIIDRLLALGASVTAHDPMARLPRERVAAGARQAEGMVECARQADALLVATEWPAYAEADPREVRQAMRHAAVLDGRNCLDHARWAAAGFRVMGVGVPEVAP